jgi:[acyl-carrier-protein] S-malonyltransferase
MGRDLWEASPAARAVLDTADRVLGNSLTRLCFEGPENDLRDTRNAQPALLAVSLACLAAALERGAVAARPAFMAGHSLGECSALVAAGALSLEEGLRFVRERARLMAEAGARNPGTLAAIIGLDVDAVREVCRAADADVCNLNLPNQVVVGGTREAVERAMAIARQRGAQRALELNVSGAFHSRLMAPAAEGLRDTVAGLQVSRAQVPVVANVTAVPIAEPDDIRRELAAQVVSPVRWFESVQALTAAGVRSFIEFGPGRVLTGMVRRLAPDAALANIAKLADAGPEATRTATV